jgi:hypothetical protein
MASSVSIANNALTLIGAEPITSFSDDNTQGRAINRVYDDLRQELLSEHPWNFAIKRASLASSTTAPVHTYARAFTLPTDCLRVLDALTAGLLYGIEERAIVTDATAPLSIVYVADITDVNLMPPFFRRALTYRIAGTIAFQITGNATLEQAMAVRADRELNMARHYDAQEGEYYEQDQGSWLESRR